MKKLCIAIFLLVIFPLSVYAASAGYSGAITSDRAFRNPVQVSGIILAADGTNSATVTLYDGTDATGTEIVKFTVKAGEYVSGMTLPLPVDCQNGLFVDVGANSTAYIFGARGISPAQ